jgi:aldose 1-epimerase
MPEDQWPFGGEVTHRIELSSGKLQLSARVKAAGRAMPLSLGWHPWFARPPGGDVAVTVPSHSVLVTSDDLIPTGASEPVADDTDLRDGPTLGDRRLDTVFLTPEGPARVSWPDLDLQISVVAPITTIVVYTPEGAACVEPQTAWPDAFRLADMGIGSTGVLTLEAGAEIEVATAFSWRETT